MSGGDACTLSDHVIGLCGNMNAVLLSFLVSADAENNIKQYVNYCYVGALSKTEMDTKCPTDYINTFK